MSWLARLGFVAAGLLLICMGVAHLQAGQVVFINLMYRQATFAAGSIGTGIVLCLLAFLPPGNWVYKHISTGRKIKSPGSKRHF
jgi:hypothetical protein